MRTTLKTSEDENYTRNEWRWKLHSKQVKMQTTIETSEDELHSKRVKIKTTPETSEIPHPSFFKFFPCYVFHTFISSFITYIMYSLFSFIFNPISLSIKRVEIFI